MPRLPVVVLVVVGLVLGGGYLHAGASGVSPGAARTGVVALSVAGAIHAASLFAGSALLRRLFPAVAEGPAGWCFALGIGNGLVAVALAAIAGLGRMGWPAAASVLAAGVAARALGRPLARPSLTIGLGGGLLALFIAAIPALVALSPPTDTDEIYQHLALARRIAEGGGLVGGFDLPEGSRPQLVQAMLAGAYCLGGVEAARLWHLLLTVALVAGAAELAEVRFGQGRALAPVVALAGSYSFLHEAGLAYNDLPAALWLLLAAELALRATPAGARPDGGRDHALLTGTLLGLAVSAKFTAAPAAAGVGLLLAHRGGLRNAARATAAGAAPLLPWLGRNLAADLHPLFPYEGWPAIEGFRFVYREKYGVGHGWVDAVLLPWNVLVHARIDSFAFLGQVSLGWAGLTLGALWEARRHRDARALAMLAALAFAAWGSSAQILRYLLPMSGVALLAAAACPWRRLPIALTLLSLPANLAPAVAEAAKAAPVACGRETAEDWLEREFPPWPALRYLRDHVPQEEAVALLYAWQSYWVRQPTRLGSVEDHTPTRRWLVVHGDAALRDLYEEGVRWVLVGDAGFLRKTYSFLGEADWRRQFVEPRDRLDRLLLRDASLQFDQGHWAVWRLDAPRAAATTPAPPSLPDGAPMLDAAPAGD